jgi:large subunit ribosomal protein L32
MPHPKKRLTSTRSGNRRSHQAYKIKTITKCSHCSKPVMPHTVCLACGYYRGTLILPQLKK